MRVDLDIPLPPPKLQYNDIHLYLYLVQTLFVLMYTAAKGGGEMNNRLTIVMGGLSSGPKALFLSMAVRIGIGMA